MRFIDRWLLAIERYLLSGYDVDESGAGHLRAVQLERLLSISPLLMLANIVNGLVVATALMWDGQNLAVMIWLCAVLTYAFLGLRATIGRNSRQRPARVSIRTIRRFVLNCAFLGILWGTLPVITFAQWSGFSNVLVMTVTTGMLGGGAIALSFIPAGAIVYLGFAFVLCTGSLMLLTEAQMMIFAPLMAMYTLILTRAALAHGRAFAQTAVNEERMRQQAMTIGILLREYEDAGRDWIWESDGKGGVVRGLDEVSAATGIRKQEIIDHLKVLSGAGDAPDDGIEITGLGELRERTRKLQIVRNQLVGVGRTNGECHWFRMNGKPVFDLAGEYCGYRGVMSNVTEETKTEQKVRFLAHYDAMTGLVNRSTFQEKLEAAIAAPSRGFAGYAVLCLDLDGFKAVNDAHGHPVGDALLAGVAERMRGMVRAGDTVARLGGDEFAILTPVLSSLGEVEPLARRLIEEISKPYLAGGQWCKIGTSVGIAQSGRHGSNASDLLHAADLALYSAKAAGKGTYRLFDNQMHSQSREAIHLEQELRQAMARGQIGLRFQPFFSSAGRKLAGFEALVRWTHPTLGEVPPQRFVPLAEKIGIINELGDWILGEACRTAAQWPPDIALAVNISVPQFAEGHVVASIERALADSGLAATQLEIEVTEGIFAENAEENAGWLQRLKALGVSVSLDDFGTGYSSLLHVMNFPVDKLKIDRSFINQAQANAAARDVFETMVDLGRKLNLATTAEGVESAEQMKMVEAVGCTFSQGCLLGAPMDAAEIPVFLLSSPYRDDRQPRRASVA